MEKPIFVVGLPRSGSTLWENIISKNAEIFRLAEVLYLTPWKKDFRYFIRKQVGDLFNENNIKKMVDIIFTPDQILLGITGSFWRFSNIRAFNEPELKKIIYRKILESDRSLESIFKILIEEITYFNGYKRCCVAFPVYPNYINKLLKWYPKCKIIHVTRDPRAIAISKTNDHSGAALKIKKYPHLRYFIRKVMIFFVIVQYIWVSKIHRKYKNNPNYALFRYEDLLVDAEMVLKKMCKFVEIDYIPEMLAPEEAMASSVTGKKFKGINPKAASHWKSIISPFEKTLISFLTKGSMKTFKFNPKKHPIYKNKKYLIKRIPRCSASG